MVPQAAMERHSGGSCRGGCHHQEHVRGQHLYQGTTVCFWRQRGAKTQDIGRSRGGQTTKIHALTDVLGRPFALHLTPGNVSDVKAASDLLTRAKSTRYFIADKAYDANALRKSLRSQGTVPVIPGRSNRKRKIRHDKNRYKERHLIENAFCRLKDFRRVATRYDKLSANFLSAVAIATIIAFWT